VSIVSSGQKCGRREKAVLVDSGEILEENDRPRSTAGTAVAISI
jgi:hypothetical protein